jgi:tetratricopeptide (TPR) repeat protein
MKKNLVSLVVLAVAIWAAPAGQSQTGAQPPAGQTAQPQTTTPTQPGAEQPGAASGTSSQQPGGQQPATGAQPAAAGQQPATGAQQRAGGAQAPQQKKEIKDPAEYNAYVSAVQQTDPNAKISGLESFLQQYPNSVMKVDALELLMAAYQQSGNAQKMIDAANRVLQADPNNLRALALLTYTYRSQAEQGNASAAPQAAKYGQQGLDALQRAAKPEGMSDADFDKLKTQTSVIFNGAVGFAALQAKDYKSAQQHLQAAVTADANNLRDVYPLAVSYLEDTPPNPLGLWYVARAVNLSNNNADVVKYGHYRYVKYHGNEQGWNELLTQSKASPTPPANFTVAPAPTPADQAKALAASKDPKQMSFDEWQLILTQADPGTADQIWNQIKGTVVPFAAKVVNATRTTLTLAATADDIQNNKPDVTVTMAAPLTASLMPKPGADIQVQATLDSYTRTPFMITMNNGKLIVKNAPRTRPTRRRRPAASQ